MHPEQRWMIKYLIVSTTLAIVGAGVAVTDPPLEKLGVLAARAVTPSWTAVSRLAPTIQSAEAQFADAASTNTPDALGDITDPDAAETTTPSLAQIPAPTSTTPFPETPALATPVPALPIFAVPARAIALPVMARTIGFIESRSEDGRHCTVVHTKQPCQSRDRTTPGCAPVMLFKVQQ